MMYFDSIFEKLSWERKPISERRTEWALKAVTDGDWFDDDLFGDEPEMFWLSPGGPVTGNLAFPPMDDHRYLVIDGDLAVSGTLCLSVWDMASVVIVTGDLRAGAVMVESEAHLYVLGRAEIEGPLLVGVSDGGGLRVRGVAKAEVLVRTDRGDGSFGELQAPVGAVDALSEPLRELASRARNQPVTAQ
jgi:hypothetical protein